MKQISLICFLSIVSINCVTIELFGNKACDCKVFTLESDCTLASNCVWENDSCSEVNCSQYNTVYDCNTHGNCAYRSDGQCSTFTQCSDYAYDDVMQCIYIHCATVPSSTIYGQYECQEMPKCSDYTLQSMCEGFSCKYESGTCSAPKCSDQSKSRCTGIRGDSSYSLQICSYSNSICSDAEMNFTKETCAATTLGKYYWNADQAICQQCGSGSYGYLIFAVGTLLLSL